LTAVMILVVTGVGSLIHIYSTAYMRDEVDSEFARYFSYLNLFAAFMHVLVLGSSFPVMFVGWDGVVL
jgi:NADH-quinone oxidoreductase subunit L